MGLRSLPILINETVILLTVGNAFLDVTTRLLERKELVLVFVSFTIVIELNDIRFYVILKYRYSSGNEGHYATEDVGLQRLSRVALSPPGVSGSPPRT